MTTRQGKAVQIIGQKLAYEVMCAAIIAQGPKGTRLSHYKSKDLLKWTKELMKADNSFEILAYQALTKALKVPNGYKVSKK